eukprot:12155302-Heterocapsa_arctica.AAC.1
MSRRWLPRPRRPSPLSSSRLSRQRATREEPRPRLRSPSRHRAAAVLPSGPRPGEPIASGRRWIL